MGIKYENVADLLKKEKIGYPKLNIFNNVGNVLKISYWQPMGEIVFEKEKGFRCCSEQHGDKAKKFLELVQTEKSDIVITPEYSVPWETLGKVIEDRDMWPRYGKLWCIGLEGISCDDFEQFCQKYQDRVKFISENLHEMNQNYFLSCVAYLFCSEGKLISIIQFKTTAASDKWVQLEAASLTTGNVIYFFSDEQRRQCLVSYICADALNQEILGVKEYVNYSECLILHPQLNPKPMHDSFGYMRKGFFDYAKQNIRIVSVNWSKDTLLRGNGEREEIKIEDSYTACYYNFCDERNIGELIKKNKSKGISLSKDEHVFIWHMPSNEHCMTFTIDSFKVNTVNLVSASHNEPLGNIYLEYDVDNASWKERTSCEICSIDWEWLQEEFQFQKCVGSTCDIVKLYKFFAILFAHKRYESIKLDKGKSQVIFDRHNRDIEENIRLRERCGFINDQLKEGNLPPKFTRLKNENYEWILSEQGNLIPKDRGDEYINVVYVDSAQDLLIKKAIVEFQKLMGDTAKDRMLLYHMSSQGIKYYNDLYNVEINNPNLTHSINLIKE